MDYSYIDAVETRDHLIVWCRGEDGELFKEKYPLSDYLYAYAPDNTGSPDMLDMWGEPVRKVSFSDKRKFRDWVKTRDNLCESDVRPVYKMLLDKFSEAPKNSPYNTMYYDIEVEVDLESGRGYPTPNNPYGEVNLFQAFDASKKKYVIIMNQSLRGQVSLSDPEFPVEIVYVKDERDMLHAISEVIEDIDVLAGWYTKGFDLPYLMVRAQIVLGEDVASKLFCRDGFSATSREFIDEYGEERVEYTLVGRQHLDMQELYKKFIPGEKTSFSLNAVCSDDIGEEKMEYDGDLGELYRENPQLFCEYGLRDVHLLRKLDAKHQIILLASTSARNNCVFFGDVTGSVRPIEMGLMKFCHAHGVVLPDKKDNEKEKFPGAIVYDTVAGRHRKVFTIDLSGLYPSTMIMLGLSPETFIMQLEGGESDYRKVMTRSDAIVKLQILNRGSVEEVVECHAHEVESLIRENGYTISGSGSIFNGELGWLAKFVQTGISLRKEYQKKSKDAFAAGDTYTGELYDLYQKVVKIGNNSVYGATGEASFRLFDLRMSMSITLTARLISKHQAIYANALVNQLKEFK